MYHSFLFFNILICLYLEFYNTVNIDNKRFPLSRISATWHQVPHKRICIIVQEIVKNTDTVSSQVNEVIFQYLSFLNTMYFWQQLWLRFFTFLKSPAKFFIFRHKTQKKHWNSSDRLFGFVTCGCISWFRLSYVPPPRQMGPCHLFVPRPLLSRKTIKSRKQ